MTKKLIYLWLTVAFTQFNLFAQNQEQIVVLPQTKGNLEGTLLIPQATKPIPVVLIIAGSGPTDRDGNNPLGVKAQSYKLLAEGLAKNQIASLRYDKRGIGQSSNTAVKEIDMRFETGADDAAQFLDTLRKDPRFSKVLVLGHSEGSLLGMLLAQKRKVDGYISVSGIAQGIDEVINEQLRPQAIPDSVKDTVKNYLATLKQGKTIPKLMQNMVIFSLFRTSIQPYMISWLRYNPSQEITKITTPILIVQGSADIQVGEKEGQALHQAAPKSTYLMIPQMNHVLKLGTLDPQESQRNYQNPDLPLAPQLVEGIVEWIKKRR